jgi:hypothetical protein
MDRRKGQALGAGEMDYGYSVSLQQWGSSDTVDTYCPGLIFQIC